MNENRGLRKVFTGNKLAELNNLGTLAYRSNINGKAGEGYRTEVGRRIRIRVLNERKVKD